MTLGVTTQDPALPDQQSQKTISDKELNFRRLEAEREKERDARLRAEMETQYLKKEIDSLRLSLQPKEVDPLDGDDFDVPDTSRLKAKFEKERQTLIKEAEQITNRVIEEREKKDYLRRLRQDFKDFDEVVNEEAVASLMESNPEFATTLVNFVPDDYERRKLLYNNLKRVKTNKVAPKEERPSIKDKVEENLKNPFYTPQSAGTPTAIEFDVKSSQARQAAYSKLKAAQKRPIGGGPAMNPYG